MKAVLKGTAVSVILALGSISFILLWILASEEQAFYLPTYLAITNLVVVFAGGAVAGKLVESKWLQHGLAVAASYFAIGYGIATAVLAIDITLSTVVSIGAISLAGVLGAEAGRLYMRTIAFFWSRKFDKMTSRG